MSQRHITKVFGPALGLGLVAGLVGSTCLCWPVRFPAAVEFVNHGLSESYGLALTASILRNYK